MGVIPTPQNATTPVSLRAIAGGWAGEAILHSRA
jgi:hypothetical protein